MGITGVTAVSGAVGARQSDVDDEELRKAQEEYASPEAVRRALREQGADLLRLLTERGILDSTEIDQFATDQILGPEEYIEAEEGTHVSAAAPDGVPSAHIKIRKKTDQRKIVVTILPQAGKRYATVSRLNGSGKTIFDPDTDAGTASDCYVGSACARCFCGTDFCSCCSWELHCCENDCYYDEIEKVGCGYGDCNGWCCEDCGSC